MAREIGPLITLAVAVGAVVVATVSACAARDASDAARDGLEETRADRAVTVALAAEKRLEVTLGRGEVALVRVPGLRDALEEARSRYAAGRSLLAEERWDEARRTFDTAMVMLSQACVEDDVFCDFAERLAPLLQP